MTESRRERDKVLAEYRKQANEKKDFAEKVDRRVSSEACSVVCLIIIVVIQLRRTSVAQSVGLCKLSLV